MTKNKRMNAIVQLAKDKRRKKKQIQNKVLKKQTNKIGDGYIL